jgi:hypothetical protein
MSWSLRERSASPCSLAEIISARPLHLERVTLHALFVKDVEGRPPYRDLPLRLPHRLSGVLGKSNQGTGGDFEGGYVRVSAKGGRLAGFFEGDVVVTGDIRLGNADCAEDFDTAARQAIDPSTIMVLGDEGVLHISSQAYGRRVAGVVSSAGEYKPGIVLDKRQTKYARQPIALLGKVYCKADARYGPTQIGDLLTTSDTPGFAMRAADSAKAFGAVIGKALCPLHEGQDLIPILIALQ